MKKIFGITCRGVSLVEVLVASVIGGVIILGSLQSLKFAMQAGGVSRAILTENNFKLTLSNALKDNCQNNLQPSDADKAKAIIPVTSLRLKPGAPDIIEIGTFKGDIDVVKMEIRAQANTDTSREFIAYYKKTNLGDLNTVSGLECDATTTPQKLGGCFKARCKLRYELGDKDGTPEIETGFLKTCESLTCHPVVLQVAGGIGPKCPWGEIWRNNKCDNRETITGGTCAKPEGSLFLSVGASGVFPDDNDHTNRVEKGGKCVCAEGTSENAEGLCISDKQHYGRFECWPRLDGTNRPASFGATKEQIEAFCSSEYQGRQVCLKGPYKRGNNMTPVCYKRSPDDINSSVEESHYKRVYNRETGKVKCLVYHNCRIGANSNYPPDTWFYPQKQ